MELTKLIHELHLSTYIAFDFETTGLDSTNDRIIEVAAIKFVNGKPEDEFVTLVNPQKDISQFITEITSISNQMVKDSPVEADIVDEFHDFLGNYPLVAHNISFDIAFLKSLWKRTGKKLGDHDLHDTLPLARALTFDHPAFNLGTTAEMFGLDASGSHRARKDAENCGMIFIRLIQEATSLPLSTLSTMVQLTQPFSLPNRSLFESLANLYARKGIVNGQLGESSYNRDLKSNIYVRQGKHDITEFSADDVFGQQGQLSASMEKYEERHDQIRFAQYVEDTITGDKAIGVIEAGTGLGKSMAYLFPALKKSTIHPDDGPVIISCYTKHLQDQLFYKDLPQLADATDIPVNAIVLKGRRNYICKTRLYALIADAKRILAPNEVESLLPVLVWLNFTKTGDMSECGGFWSGKPSRIISMITSESGYCTTYLCKKHDGCFFGKLRQSVHNAQVIIVNHSLLLTEMGAPGYLPDYNTVIIDEGHNLVNAAYQQLTIKLDRNSVQNAIRDADPTQMLNYRWTHAVEYLSTINTDIARYKDQLFQASGKLATESDALFGAMAAVFYDRYSPNDAYTKKHITDNLMEEYGQVFGEIGSFLRELNTLKGAFEKIRSKVLELESPETEYPELKLSLDKNIEQLEGLSLIAQQLTEKQDNDWVYWQEGRYYRKNPMQPTLEISMSAAPINVSETLRAEFFDPLDYGIITSATLQVDESFRYFLGRAGLDGGIDTKVRTTTFRSPFYYPDQVKYYQFSGSKSITNDPKAIASVVYNSYKRYGKRIMVLFTAHATLNAVYHELRHKPGGKDLPLFAQGFGTSRYALIKGMSSVENGILLGTNSFWEGVDLPGDLLEILIITKLPFDVPSEPIIKAYSNAIQEQGGNSFLEFSIPECVMKFRQGFGRLIRTTTDEGIFIVLDDRLITKRYGQHFRDAIPVSFTVFSHLEELEY